MKKEYENRAPLLQFRGNNHPLEFNQIRRIAKTQKLLDEIYEASYWAEEKRKVSEGRAFFQDNSLFANLQVANREEGLRPNEQLGTVTSIFKNEHRE